MEMLQGEFLANKDHSSHDSPEYINAAGSRARRAAKGSSNGACGGAGAPPTGSRATASNNTAHATSDTLSMSMWRKRLGNLLTM